MCYFRLLLRRLGHLCFQAVHPFTMFHSALFLGGTARYIAVRYLWFPNETSMTAAAAVFSHRNPKMDTIGKLVTGVGSKTDPRAKRGVAGGCCSKTRSLPRFGWSERSRERQAARAHKRPGPILRSGLYYRPQKETQGHHLGTCLH